MIKGRKYRVEQLRFLWWTVENFKLNGRDVYDSRSRFL